MWQQPSRLAVGQVDTAVPPAEVQAAPVVALVHTLDAVMLQKPPELPPLLEPLELPLELPLLLPLPPPELPPLVVH